MDVTRKKVVEASYLTADSTAHYRTILRYFYHQHERMRDFIAPEEIMEHMRSIPAFADYEEDQLYQQLAQLVKWNNLIARQDIINAKTVEEYKKKRFRYQSTPYMIEFERMLVVLEKKSGDNFQGLYYSGDIDPEGILIAERLKTRYQQLLVLWRMDVDTYKKSLSSEQMTDRLTQLNKLQNAEWNELLVAMKNYKVAGYQEAVVESLIDDIKQGM